MLTGIHMVTHLVLGLWSSRPVSITGLASWSELSFSFLFFWFKKRCLEVLLCSCCQFQIYADMEELGVRPDEDTARRIGKAFVTFGQEEKEKHVLEKYLKKWKYIHFNGERVRVRRDGPLA